MSTRNCLPYRWGRRAGVLGGRFRVFVEGIDGHHLCSALTNLMRGPVGQNSCCTNEETEAEANQSPSLLLYLGAELVSKDKQCRGQAPEVPSWLFWVPARAQPGLGRRHMLVAQRWVRQWTRPGGARGGQAPGFPREVHPQAQPVPLLHQSASQYLCSASL